MAYRMVSLDTSSNVTGYALWEAGGLVKSGEISLVDYRGYSDDRLNLMIKKIYTILQSENPQTVVIEMDAITRNRITYRILTELIGAIRGYCVLNDSEFAEYSPPSWRKLTKGTINPPKKREELKQWSINRVKEIFGIDVSSDNEADAILIGYARIVEFSQVGNAIFL